MMLRAGPIRALVLETSGRTGSVALALDGHVVASQTFNYGLANAARLIPILNELCRAQTWQPRDIAEIYVSVGPGSFTGLRIGITVAKTIAFATGATIAAVPSLLVLAHNAPPEAADVIVLLDAKRNQVFAARFHRDGGNWRTVEPPRVDVLSAMLARAPRPLWLLGEGLPIHQSSIDPADRAIHVLSPNSATASPSVVAELGHRMLRAGESTPAEKLIPLYIRRPEAEEKADEKATNH